MKRISTFAIAALAAASAMSGQSFDPLAPNRSMTRIMPAASALSVEGALLAPALSKPAPAPTRLGENAPLTPPFCEDFSNLRPDMEHEDFVRYFQVIDANKDNRYWNLYNYAQAEPYGRCAYLLFPIDAAKADDWLITRAIKLEKGKYYCVSLDAALYLEGNPLAPQPQVFEVMIGNYNDAQGLDTRLIGPVEINSRTFKHVDGWFSPQFTGIYYVGIHGISPSYKNYYNYLFVDNIAVDAPKEGSAPAGITELNARNASDGTPRVTFTFNAPAVSLDGTKLSGTVDIAVSRDGKVVKTIAGVEPGAKCTFDDVPDENGQYYYTFTPTVGDNEGAKVSLRHTTGIGAPLPPVITSFGEVDETSIHISWEAPTVDVYGNLIDPEYITYNVSEYVDGFEAPVEMGLKETELTFEPTLTNSGQALTLITVTAEINGNKSDPSNTDYISVGKPYPLPHCNSFTLSDYYKYVLAFDLSEDVTWRMFDDFSDPKAQDGDNGYISMVGSKPGDNCCLYTGKIDLRGATSPILSFYTYVYAEDENEIRVSLVDCADNKNYSLPTARLSAFNNSAAWRKISYDLSEYAGKVVRIGLDGLIVSHGYIPVDNFRIEESSLSDIAVGEVDHPYHAGLDSGIRIAAKISNNTVYSVSGNDYRVVVLEGNREVASETGIDLEPLGSQYVVLSTRFSPVSAPSTAFRVKAEFEADTNTDDNLSAPFSIAYTAPSHPVVTDLKASATEDSETAAVTLSWSEPDMANAAPEETIESFEDYDAFATDFGSWSMIDGELGVVGGFSGFEMPVDNTQQAFWIMESDGDFDFIPTHSGSKVAMAMYSFYTTSKTGLKNDDWLITPELYGGAQNIFFWGRSLNENYGREDIEIYYSTGSNKRADFKLLSSGIEVGMEWTSFCFAVPEGTKYFAVRYVSDNKYTILLDDFTFIASGKPRELKLNGYNIYRNGTQLNDTPVTATTFTTSRESTYDEYYVTTVYDRGESGRSNLAWLGVSAIDRIEDDAAGSDADPAAPVELYNLQGVRVDPANILPGIYIRRQGSQISKILIR